MLAASLNVTQVIPYNTFVEQMVFPVFNSKETEAQVLFFTCSAQLWERGVLEARREGPVHASFHWLS